MKAKDLKNSILQMAVQGKLVPQDPNDEPASILLERIRAERAKLVKEKKIKAPKGGDSVIYRASDGSHYEKRGKGESVCIEDEIPFEIPESWEWVRLGALFDLQAGKNISAARIGDIEDDEHPYPCFGGNGVRGYVKSRNRSGSHPIIGRQGALCGCVNYADGEFYATEHAVVATCFAGTDTQWACLALEALNLNQYATATAQPGLAVSKIAEVLISVPPVQEQVRIVQHAVNLILLITDYDALEASRERLDDELPGRLRKSIIQQAVQGRLVAQDSSDEPASALLKRIRSERAKLVKEKKIKAPKGGDSVIYRASDGGYYEKRGKGEPVCIDNEIPFEIPDSWEWVRLESIMSLSSGLGYKKPDLDVRSQRMIRVLRGGNISQADTIVLQDSDVFIADQFVDPNLMLLPGQIITPAVTSLENVGKAALVRTGIPNTVCGGFVFFLMPLIDDMRLSRYLHIWLTSPEHRAYCKASVKKSGQAFYNLSKVSLNNALIAVPPLLEQERIVTICERLLD